MGLIEKIRNLKANNDASHAIGASSEFADLGRTYGKHAAEVARHVLHAFGRTPGKDREIASYLGHRIQDGQILLQTYDNGFVTFAYQDKNGRLTPLVRTLDAGQVGEEGNAVYDIYGFEYRASFRVEVSAMADNLLRVASTIHERQSPYAPQYKEELGRKDMVIHLVDAMKFAADLVKQGRL